MRATNFFREDFGEVIGAYFDGGQIFLVKLAEKIETTEIIADANEINHIAEKISQICRQRGWRTSAVGFCLREEDAVTYLAEIGNLPAKEIPAFVESWAVAQAGKGAAFSFVGTSGGLWMETLPRTKFDEICAAFDKCGLNLRALSLMPTDVLTKTTPIHHAEFIAEIVRRRKSPNFLARRSAVDWRKLSAAVAAIFFAAIIGNSAILWLDYRAAAEKLSAAKISLEERREELAVKEIFDSDAAELNRLNKLVTEQKISSAKFNLLLNLGKISGGGVYLNKIRVDENFLELEGKSETPDAVKSYLSRVKSSVAQSSRLEKSVERDDEFIFTIRATF